jgi:hypothetical protein
MNNVTMVVRRLRGCQTVTTDWYCKLRQRRSTYTLKMPFGGEAIFRRHWERRGRKVKVNYEVSKEIQTSVVGRASAPANRARTVAKASKQKSCAKLPRPSARVCKGSGGSRRKLSGRRGDKRIAGRK